MTGRSYSTRTVARAIDWLTAHHVLMQTQRSRGGRGCGSVYFVRWSTAHRSLRSRQSHQNMKTGYRTSSIEENQNYSFLRKTADTRPLSPEALRWVKAQVRQAPMTAFADRPLAVRNRLADGLVVAAHRAAKRGELGTGSRLARFVELVSRALACQDSVDDCFDDDPQTPEWNRTRAYGWAGRVVREILDELAAEQGEHAVPYTRALQFRRDVSPPRLASIGTATRERTIHEERATQQRDQAPDRFALRRESSEALETFKGSEFGKLSEVVRALAEGSSGVTTLQGGGSHGSRGIRNPEEHDGRTPRGGRRDETGAAHGAISSFVVPRIPPGSDHGQRGRAPGETWDARRPPRGAGGCSDRAAAGRRAVGNGQGALCLIELGNKQSDVLRR
jgi:hypothetical protein